MVHPNPAVVRVLSLRCKVTRVGVSLRSLPVVCAQSVEPIARGRSDDLARASAVSDRFLQRDGPLLHSMVSKQRRVVCMSFF